MKKRLLFMLMMSMMVVATVSSCDDDSKDDDNTENNNNGTNNDGGNSNGDGTNNSGVAGTSVVKDGTISGTIVDGARIDKLVSKNFGNVEAPVTNGAFTLTLPTPSDNLLSSLENVFLSYGEPILAKSDINNTMGVWIYFEGRKNGQKVDDVYYEASNNRYIEIRFLYVNKDLQLKKTANQGQDVHEFNINLKAGWNMVLSTYTPPKKGAWTTGNIPDNMAWILAD